MKEEVFGIDLGTTNSCIAVIGDDGLPQVIKNLDDEYTTPSVIYFDDSGEQYAGKEAKSGMGGEPERTIAFIKREMSNTNYVRQIDGEKVTPCYASSLILKKVVDDANTQRSYDGLPPIKKAVITVPAYFGMTERQLTRQAGEIAGLQVLDLLNEPTAAALSYGKKGLDGKTFMIYDLGGGTFDVSIMRMKDGQLDTLSTDGDHHLGGVDWDIELLDYALQSLDLGITYDDIKNTRDGAKAILAAEICKKNLSKSDKAAIKLIINRRPHNMEISRGVFKELTEGLMDRTLDIVDHAISIMKEPARIDEIILVGGSSYMPMVKERLAKKFQCPIRLDNLEPDRAVAKGAAIHACNLSGASGGNNVRLGTDMQPRSYATTVNNPDKPGTLMLQNLILRTDPMIFEESFSFTTVSDGQVAVSLDIYENNSVESIVENVNYGTLIMAQSLEFGRPVPMGTQVIMRVRRGQDGIIHVTGEAIGCVKEFDIRPATMYSDAEADRLRRDLSNRQV